MQLTKKQVKALLEVMSSDQVRPVLCRAEITEYQGGPCLTATDGYILAALKLNSNFVPEIGKSVTRDQLTKWYKLAGNKDSLTSDTLLELLADNSADGGHFPAWHQFMPKSQEPTEQIGFQAKYATTLETLADQLLIYTLGGSLGPMVAEIDSGLYVLMPIKN